MIISHKYKFIFIKTAKTAGTSVEVFLSRFCACGDIITPIIPPHEKHSAQNYRGLFNPFPELVNFTFKNAYYTFRDFVKANKFYNHITAFRVKSRVSSRMWDEYYKFCIERNPWDKTVSHYSMAKKISSGNLTFDDYIRQGKFCLNYDKYTDVNGHVLVDKVVKYENLNKELGAVLGKLGIPFSGDLGVRAKSQYREKKIPYQEYFNKKNREIIRDYFSPEIEMHNYSF